MTEVASAFVSLVPTFKGGKQQIANQLNPHMEAAGAEGGERFGKGVSARLGALGKTIVAPLAAAFAGVAVGGFLKSAISEASDLNESATKTQAIFGKATTAVQQFASQGAKALGQTQLEVLNAAGTFGTFGKAAGLTGGKLATFSTKLTALSTDLASFYNTSPADAVEAIGAALRGEGEPIRKYGVLLDDATLRQEALRQGLIKTTKQALTPQQRVLAAQAVIFKQTKDAQGDFLRTSGGLANQQRILSAQWTDMKARIGKALLPAMVSLVSTLNKRLFPALSAAKDAFAGVFDSLSKAGVGDVLRAGFAKLADAVGAVKTAFGLLYGTAKTVVDILFFGDFHGGPFAEDSGFVTAVFKVRDGLTAVKDVAVTVFDTLFRGDYRGGPFAEDSSIVTGLLRIHDGIAGIFDLVINGDFTGQLARAFNVSEDSGIIEGILKLRDKVIGTITNLGDLPGRLAGAFQAAFATVQPDVQPLVDHIKAALVQTGGDLISGITTAVQTGDLAPLGKAIGGALATAAKGAAGSLGLFVGAVDTLFAKVDWGSLGLSIGKKAVPFLAGVVVGFTANITDVIPFIRDHFTEVLIAAISIIPVGRVAGALGKVVARIPFLRALEPLLGGIGSIGGAVETAFGRVFGAVGRVIGDALRLVFPEASGAVRGFFDTVITTIYVRGVDFLIAGRELFLRMLDGVRNGIVVLISDTLGGIARFVGAIVSAVLRFGGAVRDAGARLIAELRFGIAAAFGDVEGLLGSIPGRVVSAVGELGSTLFRAGTKLISGLADGIRWGLRNLAGPLDDVATFIKDHFPGSPVKRGPLTSWNGGKPGIKLMQMLAGGIATGADPLSNALNTAVGGLNLPSIGSPNLTLNGSAMGQGGVHIENLNVNNGALTDAATAVPMALRQMAYAAGW